MAKPPDNKKTTTKKQGTESPLPQTKKKQMRSVASIDKSKAHDALHQRLAKGGAALPQSLRDRSRHRRKPGEKTTKGIKMRVSVCVCVCAYLCICVCVCAFVCVGVFLVKASCSPKESTAHIRDYRCVTGVCVCVFWSNPFNLF